MEKTTGKNSGNDASFSNFGEDFQERVIQALLLDPGWSEQMHDVIRVEYFEYAHYQYMVSTYYEYYKKYATFPTCPMLATILREKLSKGNKAELSYLGKIVDIFRKVKNDPDLRDLPYVKERALEFCKKQAMKEALYESTELIIKDQYEQVLDVMKKALTAGEETSVGHDFLEDQEARFTTKQRDPIPTGIPQLDRKEVLDGGLGRGELGIFVAPPGVGKSHFLVQLGANALKKGYNVLHYTLEMGEEEVGRRYDGWMTGINNREIPDYKDEVKEWYKNNSEDLGRLIIKEYPSTSITALAFRAHMQKLMLRKNFWPDIVIVDYADEMCSIKKFDSSASRHEFKAIYRDLRNLGRDQSRKFAVWSASQTNKEGSSADIVTGENMAESFRKLDVPDVVFAGGVKPQDKSKGIMKGFLIKNRNGNDGITMPMFIDKTTSRFKVVSDEEYAAKATSDEEIEDNQRKRLRKKLRESNKDFG